MWERRETFAVGRRRQYIRTKPCIIFVHPMRNGILWKEGPFSAVFFLINEVFPHIFFFPHLLMFKITGQEQMWDVCKNMRIYRESFNNFKLAKRIALNLKLTCCGYVRTKPIFVLCASFSFTHSLSLSISHSLFYLLSPSLASLLALCSFPALSRTIWVFLHNFHSSGVSAFWFS